MRPVEAERPISLPTLAGVLLLTAGMTPLLTGAFAQEGLPRLRGVEDGRTPSAGAAAGRIVGFDQTEFFDGEPRTSLNAVGYLYVPAACENDAPAAVACRLHVAFPCNTSTLSTTVIPAPP